MHTHIHKHTHTRTHTHTHTQTHSRVRTHAYPAVTGGTETVTAAVARSDAGTLLAYESLDAALDDYFTLRCTSRCVCVCARARVHGTNLESRGDDCIIQHGDIIPGTQPQEL